MPGAPLKAVVFERSGDRRLGRLEGLEVVDAGPIGDEGFVPTPDAWQRVRAASGPCFDFGDLIIHAPLRPKKILAIGINYREHAAESNNEIPDEPVVFAKFPSSVIGHGDTIIVPIEETRPDWEAEMAVVIGRPTYRADAEDAIGAIGAFTALNDVSGRRAQLETPLKQFTLGKSFDTHGPIGPWLVTADEIGDPHGLRMRTWVNDELRQDTTTDLMVFDCWDQIEIISTACTLEPGDVIATGTSSGVALGFDPPKFLADGDVVRIEVENIGTI